MRAFPPFVGIYAEAKDIAQRLCLLELAKEYYIRKQDWEPAAHYRDAERRMRLADYETGKDLEVLLPPPSEHATEAE